MRDSISRALALAVLLGAAVAGGHFLGRSLAPDLSPPVYRDLRVAVRGPESEQVSPAWISLSAVVPSTPPHFQDAGGGPVTDRGEARYRLPPARYRLQVRAEGYMLATAEADLSEADAEITVRLDRAVVLVGTVVGPDGSGVPRIRVSIAWRGGEREVLTDEEGAYESGAVPWTPIARWLVDVKMLRTLRRPPTSVKLIRSRPWTPEIEGSPIALTASARVVGRLVGRRAGEAEVLLTNRWCRDPLVHIPGEAWFKRGPDGAIDFQYVPSGPFEVFVVLGPAGSRIRRLELAPGRTVDLGVIPAPDAPNGTLSGRMVFLPGEPRVGGARPVARSGFVFADESGSFRLEGLFGKEVTLEAGVKYGEHYLMVRERVAVGRSALEFAPTPARRLRIELVDEVSGERLAEIRVAVSVGDPPLPGSDFYFLRDVIWTRPLEPGTHGVTIRARGYETARLPAVTVAPDRETRLIIELRPLP